jgi:hypothetical protein
MLLVHDSSRVMLFDPTTKAPIDGVSGSIERYDRMGSHLILQVDNWGWRERDGILVHDLATRKEIMFEACEHLEDDVPTLAAGGHVFAVVDYGEKIVALPKGRPLQPLAGYKIRHMVLCGNAIVAICEKSEGTSYRRVIGLGLPTLNVRFDLGEMHTSPGSDWEEQLCTNGTIAVYVNELQEGEYEKDDDDWGDHHKLFAIDQGGRTVWTLQVREWEGHWFLGASLVVQTSRGWWLVRPEDGHVIARTRRR